MQAIPIPCSKTPGIAVQGTITKIADQTGVTNHSVIPPADQTLTVKSVPTVPHPVMVHAAR